MQRPTRRKAKGLLLSLFLSFVLLPPAAVFAQNEEEAESSRSEASQEEASQESKESEEKDSDGEAPGYEELLESLQSLPDNAELSEELHAAYTSLEDPREAVKLIRRFLPVLETRAARYSTLYRLAELEEAIGEIEKAQLHYQAAAFAASGAQRYQALLNSADMLIRQGHYRQAQLQLTRITESEDAGEYRLRAKLALISAFLLEGDTKRAGEMIEAISPEELRKSPFLLYRGALLAHTLGKKELKNTAQKLLYSQFPNSPETALLRGEAGRLPDVHSVFGMLEVPREMGAEKIASERGDKDAASGPESTTKSAQHEENDEGSEKQSAKAIQAGSFTDRENAVYMRKELESQGFSTVIKSALVKETEYHRVLVEIGESQTTEQVILKLKEKGYEGYPVY